MGTTAVAQGRILFSPTSDGGLGGLARPAGAQAISPESQPILSLRDINVSITREQLERFHQTPGEYDLRGHIICREGGGREPQPLDTRFVVRQNFRVCMVGLPPLEACQHGAARYSLLIDPNFEHGASDYSPNVVVFGAVPREKAIDMFNLAVALMESEGIEPALKAVTRAAATFPVEEPIVSVAG